MNTITVTMQAAVSISISTASLGKLLKKARLDLPTLVITDIILPSEVDDSKLRKYDEYRNIIWIDPEYPSITAEDFPEISVAGIGAAAHALMPLEPKSLESKSVASPLLSKSKLIREPICIRCFLSAANKNSPFIHREII